MLDYPPHERIASISASPLRCGGHGDELGAGEINIVFLNATFY